MLNTLNEMFLTQYFYINYVINDESNKILSILKNVFFIDDDNYNNLIDLINKNSVLEIKTEDDYKRYLRIKQFNELIGNNLIDKSIDNIIYLKGEALKKLERYEYDINSNCSYALIEKKLINLANSGNIIALTILGFLQCEGIVVNKNTKIGLANLNKASRWGSLEASLIYLNYDKNIEVVRIINSIIKDSLYDRIKDLIKEKYELETTEYNEEIFIINKAISRHILKADIYNFLYSKIIFSNILKNEYKEKILLSEENNNIIELAEMPLNLCCFDYKINTDVLAEISFKRTENDRIKDHLINYDNPFGIIFDSNYLFNYYIDLVKSIYNNSNVEIIEANEINPYDINPNKNNIFLRNINEKKNNAYVISVRGRVHEEVINYIKSFLKIENRKKFFINNPSICVDISSIPIVLIADKDNYDSFKNIDYIDFTQIKNKDKSLIIENMIKTDGEILNEFVKLSIDKASDLLNKFKKDKKELTVDNLNNYLKGNVIKNHAFGFGGSINENY